jgi:hypothetical protein
MTPPNRYPARRCQCPARSSNGLAHADAATGRRSCQAALTAPVSVRRLAGPSGAAVERGRVRTREGRRAERQLSGGPGTPGPHLRVHSGWEWNAEGRRCGLAPHVALERGMAAAVAEDLNAEELAFCVEVDEVVEQTVVGR